MEARTHMPARIVLVDDHPVFRWGLRQLFEREPDLTVCAEADTLDAGFQAVERLAPDLLVTDLTLEGRGGLELTEQVRRYCSAVSVLVVSMHDEALFAARALAAGALGYVMKGQADREAVPAARAILAGKMYWGAEGRQALEGRNVVPDHIERDPVSSLSDREFEVFLLLGQGYAPRHIAEDLCLSVSTVEAYRERMKEKLGVPSSPLLLRYAVRWCKDRRTV
jgi:DNA-binding NarL/FixJ family response regulator